MTFRLVSRSSGEWMGAAVYELSGGTWSAGSYHSWPDDTCVGQGNGRASGGSLRYNWRGTAVSTGAGAYWIDVTSTDEYRTRCSHHEVSKAPQFTFGFKPATGGVHPDHLKDSLTVRLDPGEGQTYETWTWNLSAP